MYAETSKRPTVQTSKGDVIAWREALAACACRRAAGPGAAIHAPTSSRFGRLDVWTFGRFQLCRAYTLIELLIVVAVLGISGALLVPQLVGRDVMACQAAVRLVIGDLSFAQSDALSHQELRRVHFNDDGSGYSICRITDTQLNQAFDPDTADYINDPLASSEELGHYVVNFLTDDRFGGITISAVNLDGSGRDIAYDSMGGTVAPSGTPSVGGTIVVSSPNESYEITVSPFTGKLTVRRL